MSDARNDSQTTQTALVQPENANPYWELTAPSVAYPLEVDNGSKTFALGIHLAPYETREWKSAIAEEKTGWASDANGEVAAINRTYREYFPIVLRHFLRLDGVTSKDVAKQKKHLEENPNLLSMAAREGYGGIRLVNQVNDGPSEELDIESVSGAPLEIELYQRLWDPASKTPVMVRMTQRMRPPTQAQTFRANSAIKTKMGKKGRLLNDMNPDVIEMLYAEGAHSVDGMMLNGQPCTEANRADWIPKIPLWHRIQVVLELYRENRTKN